MQDTLQVRPCKLDAAIHGANGPASPPPSHALQGSPRARRVWQRQSRRKNKGAFRRLCLQATAALFQPLATVATALATYSRLFWFSAATQMRPVPTA